MHNYYYYTVSIFLVTAVTMDNSGSPKRNLRYCLSIFTLVYSVKRYQKDKPFWILLKERLLGITGISWTICKSFAPHSR